MNIFFSDQMGTIITVIGSALGLYTFLKQAIAKELKMDIEKIEKGMTEYRNDMKEYRADMKRIDERWERLFEKLHMIDKDVDALKNKSTKKKAA